MELLAIRLSEQTTLAQSLVIPYRQAREDVIDEVRGSLDHASGGAGGADATAFVTEGNPRGTGVSHQEVVTAVGAAGAGKTVGEDAAVEVAAEFALRQCRGMAATAVVVQRQPGGEVILHHVVEQRAFGLAPVVNGRHTARFGGSGRHGHPDLGIG